MNFKVFLTISALTLAGLFSNAQAVCMRCIRQAQQAAARARAAVVVVPVIQTLNKQIIVNEIKSDLDKAFILKIGIGVKDYAALAQGNPVLEADLKALYMAFNEGEIEAQKALDAFCAQWQINAITIAEIC